MSPEEISHIHNQEKETLLSELLQAVKQCQIRFGGRAELATESDPKVAVLCHKLEVALSHGLRNKSLNKTNPSTIRQVTDIVSNSLSLSRTSPSESLVFWHYVREHLTRHEFERYLLLKEVWSDLGRGKAWLRSALNEKSLERYIHSILGNAEHLSQFYEEWAFVLDQERSSMLPTMAAGLGSILFAISIDNPELNHISPTNENFEPLVESLEKSSENTSSQSKEESINKKKLESRKKKRIPAHIISFEDEEEDNKCSSVSQSAPPTCLNSPTAVALASLPAGHTLPRPLSASVHEATAVHPNSLSNHIDKDRVILDGRPNALKLPKEKTSETRITSGHQTLTPVNNLNVGELIPVSLSDETHSEEDSLSVPSYSEDTDCAAAALLATQKLLQANRLDFVNNCGSLGNNINENTQLMADASCLLNDEMRGALLTIITRKEELQAETRELRRMLEHSQDECGEARAELEQTNRVNVEKLERLEVRVQALTRENELLKHQLRKYVAAVQMLKRDGTKAHEALASLEASSASGAWGDGSTFIGGSSITVPRQHHPACADYHNEAREYERKLIQVAEMHGELMEFNERLHRLLGQKESTLKRLRDELISLRGPLPNDPICEEEEGGTNENPSASMGLAEGLGGGSPSRVLVNIWIPSAFLTGGSSDAHHVYQVFVRIRDDEWNIYRRYAQFFSLHKELKRHHAVVNTFDFPPKKTLGNKDARFVEERRRRLQNYLRSVVNHLIQSNSDLASAPDKDLLIALIPFFGEHCYTNTEEKKKKRTSPRNPFSRLSSRGQEVHHEHSPQYTGL